MRHLLEHIFKLIVEVHVFANRKRVKAAGSLLYVIGAVIVTLARNQLRMFGRILLQSPITAQLKSLVVSGVNNLGSMIQLTDTMFR